MADPFSILQESQFSIPDLIGLDMGLKRQRLEEMYRGEQRQELARKRAQEEKDSASKDQEKIAKTIGLLAKESRDPASWDARIDHLISVGVTNAEKYRGKFSPETRAAFMAAGGIEDKNDDTTAMQRNYEYLKTVNPALAESYIQNQGDPIQWARGDNGDGTFTMTPMRRSGQPATTAQPMQPPAGAGSPFSVNGVPGDQETSGRRSTAHNAAVGGVPNSYHLSGQASDRIPPAGMDMATFAAELQRRNPNLEVINEGDHVHLEPRGRQARSGGTVSSKAAYDALPSGARYIAPDGSERVKS